MIKTPVIILASLIAAPVYAETITCPSPDQITSTRVTQTGVAFEHLWSYYDSINDNEFMGFSKLATPDQSQGMLLSDDGQDILCAYHGTDNNAQVNDEDGYTIKMTHHDTSQTCTFTQGDVQPGTSSIYWQSAPCDDEASCNNVGTEMAYKGTACQDSDTGACEITCT